MTTPRIGRRVPRLRDLRVGSLPTELPVFPLPGALLLPRGKLPLNIFEPRYLALVEDVLAGDRLFGMIQPSDRADETDEAAEIAEPDAPELFMIGCVGRLTSFAEREDGTCSLSLTGLSRFRVAFELGATRGYRRLSVSYRGFERDMDEPGSIDFDRDGLLQSLRRFFTHRGFEARWEAIEQMDDDTLLTTLGMICPFPPAEKQALLEAPTLSDRARTLQALLEMAGHGDDDATGRSHAV